MSLTLADTSVWVAYLRGGAGDPIGAELAAVLERGELVVCGPVVSELLTGTGERDRDRLGATLRALDWVDLDRSAWIAAGELAAKLRGAGATVPLTDVTIAVAAISADAQLLSTDSDFERIAELEHRLRVRSLAS